MRLDRGAGAREALLRTVVTLGTIAIAVAMGVGLERLVYEVPPARGHAGLEHVKRFANAETAERLWQIPAAYTNAVMASKPAVVPNSIQQGRWDYSIMFTFESDEISSLERVSRSLVTGLLIAFGIWGWGVSGAGRHPVFLAASGVLLFNFVLHTFWGKELFLYSPHWTTALGVLIAGGFRSTAGARAKMVGLVGFVLLLAVNDLWLVEGMNRVLERERRPQAAASHARAESPPNVVVIVSDDQGFTDFGFMGHPLLETPNLDRLAQQSLTFPNGYVPTALCRPSLATLLNGQYPHEHAIHFNDAPRGREAEAIALLDRHPTLPQLLGRAGYVSFQSGKHWEGSYQKAGFTRGMTHGDPDRGVEPHPTLTRLKARHGDRGLTIGRDGMGPVLEFLDEMERSREAPFLLWYAPFMPHQPFNAPASHRARYEGLGLHPRVAAYYAMVSWFDATVGELVDALESRGFDRDTLVVFVVDNGWATNTEAPTPPYAPRSKGSPYEMGVRTPILLRWTGTIEPGIHTELASSIDIAPTILAAAGLDGEAKRMPGIDLFSLAKGEEGGDRRAVFGESYRRRPTTLDEPGRYLDARWVRAGNWKLIVGTDGSRHLYDLKNDPLEKRDLARDPRSRATIRTLERQLDAWWRP